jgi:hypothetical protein
VKAIPRGRWSSIAEALGLEAAFELARKTSNEGEVGVFVDSAAGGFLYWTSRVPELFNSIALKQGYS